MIMYSAAFFFVWVLNFGENAVFHNKIGEKSVFISHD